MPACTITKKFIFWLQNSLGKLLSPGIFVFLLGLAVTGIQKEFSETELRCERGHVAIYVTTPLGG